MTFSDILEFLLQKINKNKVQQKFKLIGREKTTSISCCEFSTLYTKILYDVILKILTELIGFCFKGGDGEFIKVDGHGANWTKERRSREVDFPKSTVGIRRCKTTLLGT